MTSGYEDEFFHIPRLYQVYELFQNGMDGGARRDRTADLLHAMQALSQLSYSP